MDREELIRERAYLHWERAGRPAGREHEFWAQALSEIEEEYGSGQETKGDNRFVAR